MLLFLFFFFFSSRRRHTRCSRDWSSDVCSSDLGLIMRAPPSREWSGRTEVAQTTHRRIAAGDGRMRGRERPAMDIAIPLFDRITALDAIGPYEVLSRLPGARIRWVAVTPGPYRTDNR